MLTLVLGGSGSGKSAFAEAQIVSLPCSQRIYLATMLLHDGECRRRVLRHRALRTGKGFTTMERPSGLAGLELPPDAAVLLEDLSNLAANEYFGQGPEGAFRRTLEGVSYLHDRARELVVVSNDLFSDGAVYDGDTAAYLRGFAELNRAVAERADRVYEVVCGIPITWKGGKP